MNATRPCMYGILRMPKEETKELDWGEAEEHLNDVEQMYLSLMGMPGVNVSFFFIAVLPPIRGAFNQGIRDEQLHAKIMALK